MTKNAVQPTDPIGDDCWPYILRSGLCRDQPRLAVLLLKRMKERSPERVRRLTSHLWTGLQINGEPKAGVRLAFRTGAKTKTRRAKADARE